MLVTVLTLTTGSYSDERVEVLDVFESPLDATLYTQKHLEKAAREYMGRFPVGHPKTEQQLRNVLNALRFHTEEKCIRIDIALVPDSDNNSIAWQFENYVYEWTEHELVRSITP